MTAAKPRIPYTYDDYRTLPEDMSRRYELLDGDLYMVPAPTTKHQLISSNLHAILREHARRHQLGAVFYAPVDVILGQGDAREVAQPDIVFIAEGRRGIIQLHGIAGPPDLVVEILSPGTQERDRGYKRTMYARHGVGEYWIVDPESRTVEVYAGAPERYDLAARHEVAGILISALFPGLEIPLREVFGD
jgi:Uma2 family endonuclease